nr:MAG TPA: hypothetical protein [Caudoviricetes sp.]
MRSILYSQLHSSKRSIRILLFFYNIKDIIFNRNEREDAK